MDKKEIAQLYSKGPCWGTEAWKTKFWEVIGKGGSFEEMNLV